MPAIEFNSYATSGIIKIPDNHSHFAATRIHFERGRTSDKHNSIALPSSHSQKQVPSVDRVGKSHAPFRVSMWINNAPREGA
jgi:hypothetical protein